MITPKQADRQAKVLFRACRRDGMLDAERVAQTGEALVAVRPRGCLAILQAFAHLVKLEQDRCSARVESAVPLTAEEQRQFSETIRRRYGVCRQVGFTVEPGLIGGLRIHVGSDEYDNSVSGRLERLLESLSH